MSNRLKFLGNRLVTYDVYHRTHIKQDYKRLRRSLYRYTVYKLRFILKWYKKIVDYASVSKRRKRVEFAEKLKGFKYNLNSPDTVEAFKSMADGKMYTSKAAYRQEVKGRGLEELGNDTQEPTELDKYYANLAQENDIKQDIKDIINGTRS